VYLQKVKALVSFYSKRAIDKGLQKAFCKPVSKIIREAKKKGEPVENDFIKRILDEAIIWDIDSNFKHYFFKKFFTLKDLNSLDSEPNIVKYYETLFEHPLLTALLDGNYKLYKRLLELGVKDKKLHSILNQKNILTQQGLLHLVSDSDDEVVEFLLDHELDVNLTNGKIQTPLHIACGNGNIKVVKLLLEKNANFTTPDTDGFTPLELACKFSHVEVVEALIKHGFDIDSLNSAKKQKLIQMTHPRCRGEIAKLLLFKTINQEQQPEVPQYSFDTGTQLTYANFFLQTPTTNPARREIENPT